MSHIIAITNQKGGVGKTTTAVSLAAVLAESGADVLLIDMDPQANATVACGMERRSVEHGVMDVMLGTRSVEDTCIYCENSHIWLMPANADLTGSDEALFQENMRHALLKKHIHGWAERFDWVLIDSTCSPSTRWSPPTTSSCPSSANTLPSKASAPCSIPSASCARQ